MKIRTLCYAGLAVVVAGGFMLAGGTVIGCSNSDNSGPAATRDSPAVNNVCPIMVGNKVDPNNVPANLTRMFKGRKVGFCCGGCPVAWDKLTDEQREKKLEDIGVSKPRAAAHGGADATMNIAAVNKTCPIMAGSKIDPDNVPAGLTRMFKGQKVGFCCGGCPSAWDKLTVEQREKKLTAAK